MRRRVECRAAGMAQLLASVTGCGADDAPGHAEAPPRAVPQGQSAAARALRLPLMAPSPGRVASAEDQAVVVEVQLRWGGAPLRDSTRTVPPSIAAGCGAAVVDTAPALQSGVVTSAIVWVEGPASTFVRAPAEDRRAMVRVEGCRLQPSLQMAEPGSGLLLVMRDSFPESLVVVPSSPRQPVDTVAFSTHGQLVPLQRRADSAGVVAVYSTQLPWSRAYVVIAPTSSRGMPDREGRVRFTLDGRARFTRIRAWHPVLGSASVEVPLNRSAAPPPVTLTFRR